MISYEDFAKLEITIGEILSVEVVEDADKLLRLMVNIGETESDGVTLRPRQIISGIRKYFEDPQTLVGRKCPFLTNLEPRVIRGYESQGMILAVSHEETLGLLIPHRDVPVGTRIK